MDVTVVHLHAVADGAPARRDRGASCCRSRSRRRGLAFRLEAQTEALVAGESGRVARGALQGRRDAAGRPRRHGGRHPPQHRARRDSAACTATAASSSTTRCRPSTRASTRSANASPPRHRLRPGRAAVRAWPRSAPTTSREFGIGRYQGSQTSTKLKVTGIDLFSAGDFSGGEGTEEIVLADPVRRRLQEARASRTTSSSAPCLYGDTVDGAWYFKLLRDGRSVADDPRPADVRRVATSATPATRARAARAAMADDAEVCGCNGVCKGTIVKAIKEQRPVHARRGAQAHQGVVARAARAPGLVEQILMATAGGDYSAAPKQKPLCGCTDRTHQRGARRDPRAAPAVDRRRDASSSTGARRTAARPAGRRSTTT